MGGLYVQALRKSVRWGRTPGRLGLQTPDERCSLKSRMRGGVYEGYNGVVQEVGGGAGEEGF